MSGILTAVYAIIIFSLIIFIHELGHFITAKIFGVYVSQFAIGMGPAIFKKQKGETLYAIRCIPIGGYCAMEGENGEVEGPRSFGSKTKLQRFIILFSGAFMNLVLGFIIMLLYTGIYSPMFVSTTVNEVKPDMPAAEAGIKPGDKIIKVNGYGVMLKNELDIYGSFEDSYRMTVLRKENGKNKKYEFDVTPRYVEMEYEGQKYKQKMIGISMGVIPKNFGTVIEYGYKNTVFLGKMVLISLKQLIHGTASVSDLSGPVGIVGEINTAAKSGLSSILFIAALITVNLGLFNLLPLPALDGGRIFFILIEAIIRKPIPPKYEGLCHGIGFALLLLLMIYATGNDIMRLIK